VRVRKLLASIGTLVLVLLVIGGYLWFAPQPLGGPVSYVVTTGISMEPRLHDDDLVIVREAPSYRVGDVAAYRSEKLNRVVLHRIIGTTPSGFVFQGDNNNFIDQDRPAGDEILGKKWLVVPRGGKVLRWIGNPATATALVFAIGLVLFVGFRARTARKRRRSAPSPVATTDRLRPRTALSAAIPPFAVGGVLLMTLGAVSFAQPLERRGQRSVGYEIEGEFRYESDVVPSPVYPSGVVKTGDPLFLKLVDNVDISFETQVNTDSPKQIYGSSALVAELSSPTGWKHTEIVQSKSDFEGDAEIVAGTIDLRRLSSLALRVQRMTGVEEPSFSLTISPKVRLSGEVAGQAIEEVFGPPLQLQFDSLKVQLPPAETDGGPAAPKQLRPMANKTVLAPQIVPNSISVGPLTVRVGVLRVVAVAGAILGCLLAVVVFLVRKAADDPDTIARRYGKWMIEVETLRPTSERTAIQVRGMDELVELAERYDRLILHQKEDGIHSYVVEDSNIAYWYQAFVTASQNDSNVTSLPSRSRERSRGAAHSRHRVGDALR
jgi:signal peptidase I